MKQAQVEYNSKGKNGSWDAYRLVSVETISAKRGQRATSECSSSL